MVIGKAGENTEPYTKGWQGVLSALAVIVVGVMLSVGSYHSFTLAGGSYLGAASPDSTSLVISQVFGGGGSSVAATYCRDYIELFNPKAVPVSLSGWSLQYASAANNFSAKINLPNVTVQPGRYYLIHTGGPTLGACTPPPAPDFDVGSPNISNESGKVALVNNTTPLECGTAGNRCTTSPQFRASLIDFVGYGSASDYEGAGATGTLSTMSAAVRKVGGCTDTDNNLADFTVATAFTPRNSLSAANPCVAATATSTATLTATGTATRTATSLPIATLTATSTATSTSTSTDTPAPTFTPPIPTGTSLLPTNTPSATLTSTPSMEATTTETTVPATAIATETTAPPKATSTLTSVPKSTATETATSIAASPTETAPPKQSATATEIPPNATSTATNAATSTDTPQPPKATATPTRTLTPQPPTSTATSTATSLPSSTPTVTVTRAAQATGTATLTGTPTGVASSTPTASATRTPIAPTSTATATTTMPPASPTLTFTPTSTSTSTSTSTPAPPTATATTTRTATSTSTTQAATPTRTPSATSTVTATVMATRSATAVAATPTVQPMLPTSTAIATATATVSPPSPTNTATVPLPTGTATVVIGATASVTPSVTPGLSVSTATPTPTLCPLRFMDVPTNNSFYPAIRCMACRGIISGYRCGGSGEPCDAGNTPYFRPNAGVTRGQLSKIVSNSAGFGEDAGAPIYSDVPTTDTFYVWVNRLSRRGVMGGYPCGEPNEPCGAQNRPYFRPGANATRGQIAKVVSNALNVANAAGLPVPPGDPIYEDVPSNSAFYPFIQRLTGMGVMSGYPCGGVGEPCGAGNRPYFRPGTLATRGQTSKIVANTFLPACYTPFRR